jgi:hypothetical protein
MSDLRFRGITKWATQACPIPHGLTVSSPGVYGAGWERVWHNDGLTGTHPPPDLTTMRCVISTEGGEGGETLSASSVRAAKLLSAEALVEIYSIHPKDVFIPLNSLTPIRVRMGTKNSCPVGFLW